MYVMLPLIKGHLSKGQNCLAEGVSLLERGYFMPDNDNAHVVYVQ